MPRRLIAALVTGVVVGAGPIVVAPVAAQIGGATATVSVGWGVLNARSGPGTTFAIGATATNGTRLTVQCQVTGQRVSGTVRTTSNWLRLSSGRYVTDAYVRWSPSRPSVPTCGGNAVVRTTGGTLNVRSNASTLRNPVGSLRPGASVSAQCQIGGDSVSGTARNTNLWLRVGNGRYVSDGYVGWNPSRPNLPWCDQPRDPAPSGERAFIEWAAVQARPSWRTYRVPVSVSIAQAINESGWGRSGLTAQGNSYFGIKCFGTPGPIAAGCRPYATQECNGGPSCWNITDTFRVYRSAADSFEDHGRFLTVNPRYQPAFNYTRNPDQFIREVHRAGYATDPNYSTNLIRLMRQYNLYQYD